MEKQSTTAQPALVGSNMPTTMPPALLRQRLLDKIPRPAHFKNERQPGETFKAYKERLRDTNWWVENYLKRGYDAKKRDREIELAKEAATLTEVSQAV